MTQVSAKVQSRLLPPVKGKVSKHLRGYIRVSAQQIRSGLGNVELQCVLVCQRREHALLGDTECGCDHCDLDGAFNLISLIQVAGKSGNKRVGASGGIHCVQIDSRKILCMAVVFQIASFSSECNDDSRDPLAVKIFSLLFHADILRTECRRLSSIGNQNVCCVIELTG